MLPLERNEYIHEYEYKYFTINLYEDKHERKRENEVGRKKKKFSHF